LLLSVHFKDFRRYGKAHFIKKSSMIYHYWNLIGIMYRKAVIRVSGTVQGVGFRPYVYRTAKALGITGYVKNLGDAGVEIAAAGTEERITELVERIKKAVQKTRT